MSSKKSTAVAEQQPAPVADKEPNVDKPALELTARERAVFEKYRKIYPVHVMTRKSFGLMMRKLSVTESQKSAQFPGTFPRRKLSVASANWAQVA